MGMEKDPIRHPENPIKDSAKTRKELLKELSDLRKRFSELETSLQSKNGATTSTIYSSASPQSCLEPPQPPDMALERNRAGDAARESEQKSRELADSLPQGIVEFAADGRLTFVNRYCYGMFGYTREDFDGGLWIWQMIDSADRPRATANILNVLNGSHGSPNEYRAVRKDGTIFPISAYAARVTQDGRPIAVRAIILDITEQKMAEDALRASEKRFRSLFETSKDSIFLVNHETGGILAANPAARQLYGYSQDELYMLKITDISAEPGMTEASLKEEMLEIPFRLHRKKDGTIFPVEITRGYLTERGSRLHAAFIRDITERRKDEETLLVLKKKFEKTFAINPAAIVLTDLEDGRIIEMNDAGFKMFGYGGDQAIGTSTLSLWPNPEDRANFVRDLREAGALHGREQELVRKSGERFTALYSADLLTMSGRQAILSTWLDITDRKRIEEELRKSEKRYRGLFKHMPDGLFAIDMDKKICEANGAFCSMLGYSHDRLLSLTYKDITPGKRHVPEETMITQQVLTRGYSDPYEKEYIKSDGTLFPAELRMHLLRDGKGNASKIWGFVRDLTRRKKVEAALRESEERFRSAFELGLIGMAITSPAKGIIAANSEVCKIFGYEKSELMQLTWPELVHPDDLARSIRYFNRAVDGMIDEYTMDIRSIRKDGRLIFIDLSARCLRRPDGSIHYFVVLLQDITERKEAEDELKRREKELIQKSFDLQEANTALKVLLRHREEDKAMLEDVIQANVKEFVFPYLDKLRKTHLSDPQATYLTIIESGLNQIISPFLQKLGAAYSRFTPTEIQVANLIRSGKSSKNISKILNVSVGTVEAHRNNMRDKLGLRHKNVNLHMYLLSLSKT